MSNTSQPPISNQLTRKAKWMSNSSKPSSPKSRHKLSLVLHQIRDTQIKHLPQSISSEVRATKPKKRVAELTEAEISPFAGREAENKLPKKLEVYCLIQTDHLLPRLSHTISQFCG